MQIEDQVLGTELTGDGVDVDSVIDVSEVAPEDRTTRRPRVVLDFRDLAAPTDQAPTRDRQGERRTRPDVSPLGPLHGRVAVVTGGASGVGRAIALELAGAGARVCVLGRDLAELRETVELAGPSAAILFLQCDVGSVTEIEGVVDFIDRFDRPVDILVHAEGVQVNGGVEQGSIEDLDEQYLVNVRGPYVMSQKLISQLRAGQGHVVFINASHGPAPRVELGQFSMTNQALRALADTLREEVRPAGVRVTSICPEIGTSVDGADELRSEDIAASVVHAVQTPRHVEVTDIQLRASAAGVRDDSSV